ncbi:MAG TPA: hypothetical protein VGL04_09240 [Sporichthyaceae bacterium]
MNTSAISDAVLHLVTDLATPYVQRGTATLEAVPDHPNVLILLPRPAVNALYLAVHADRYVCDLILDDAEGHLGTVEIAEGGLDPVPGLISAILQGRATARITRLGKRRWATALRWGPTTWHFPAPAGVGLLPQRQWVEYRPYD